MRLHRIWLPLALLAGCASPPPEAYIAGAGSGAGVPLGQDSNGGTCTQQTRADGAALVYCGDAAQPSARVIVGSASAAPMALAETSAWRRALDGRFTCEPPVAAALSTPLDAPAAELRCNYRIEGFPHIGLVTVLGDKAYYGDADPSAAAMLQRAIGVMSGRVQAGNAATLPSDPGLEAMRAAYQSTGTHDRRAYDELMEAGVRANLTDNYAAAEIAFRQAAALQSADNPARADPLIHQALQLSNLGRYADSNAVFATADAAIAQARKSHQGELLDPTVVPRLALYRALSLLNQNHPQQALPLLDSAEQGFTQVLPPDQRTPHGPSVVAHTRGLESMMANLADQQLFAEPTLAAALLGLITTKRARAVAYLALGRLNDGATQAADAETLASQHGMAQAILEARILRTSAMIDAASGNSTSALQLLTRSVAAFNQVFPDSRPLAETELLRAAALLKQGRAADGEQVCRGAIDVLSRLKAAGITPALMMPCLDAFAAAAAAANSEAVAQDAYAEMFAAAQLAQSTVTSTEIAQAAARLAESQRDTRVGKAIRRFENDADALDRLYRQRDALSTVQPGAPPPSSAEIAALNDAIAKAEAEHGDAAAALQEAAPNYGQLIQEVVSARQVQSLLNPDEALAMLVLGEDHGWTLLLRNGGIAVSRIDGGTPRMQTLVNRVRASMAPGADGLPPAFDTAAAQALYDGTLRGTAALLKGTNALVVAPSGPLLAVPFALLLTGPAGDNLSRAPWLVQQMTVAHVPAPANFVSLRKLAGGKHAPQPWIGFGNPSPVTLAQATASFPAATCAASARLLATLPPLPGAGAELDEVRKLLGGTPQDEILGDRFTTASVVGASLQNYQVVEFATHGLLPAELACQPEPALLTSPPTHAQDAASALLDSLRIATLTLNADVVILSACDSGGPEGSGAGGETSGESLSGLARSFFFAGARSLLATHWSVNDQVTTILVAQTMKLYHDDTNRGLATALALEQRDLLAQADANGAVGALAHPFYWAPLALIGDGGAAKAAITASRAADARL